MPNPVRQAAAIPIRDGLVCMVTSRSGRRWVIPKGRIEIRQTAADAAATEAWEEAGVLGTLSPDSVGTFEYDKDGRCHQAVVFVLTVDEVREQWPEQYDRRREWVSPEEAVTRIEEPELRKIVRAVFRSQRVATG